MLQSRAAESSTKCRCWSLGLHTPTYFPFPHAFPFGMGHGEAHVSAGTPGPCCDTNKIRDSPDRKYHSHSLRFWNNFFSKILLLAFPPALLTNRILLLLPSALERKKQSPCSGHKLITISTGFPWSIFSSFLKTSNFTKRLQLPSSRGSADKSLWKEKGQTGSAHLAEDLAP